MIEGEPSQTALQVAAARAAHLRFDPPPHLLEDRFAEKLLGEEAERLIAAYGDDAPWILRENRLFLPFRARYAEDLVARAHAEGVRQLVVLGAGLDSFALRRPAALADLRVFEVDHPATQRWKRRRLEAIGDSLPDSLAPSLVFVECDFEKMALADALRGSAFRADAPAVVSWLGVVYYLSKETVARALAELRALLAPGSAVVLDYQFPVESLPQRYRDVFAQQSAWLKGAGEPQVNRYRPDELRAVLLAAGFEGAELPEREALEARYFRALGSEVRMAERFGMAVARVGESHSTARSST
ncbi:MAG: class I SAM-dependent methyltransferase [Myxococcota bacterium]